MTHHLFGIVRTMTSLLCLYSEGLRPSTFRYSEDCDLPTLPLQWGTATNHFFGTIRNCESPITFSIHSNNVTYHFLSTVSGLYLRYFIFHWIFSLHRWQIPQRDILLMFCIFFDLSCRSFLNALTFWCFWGPVFLMFPFCELIAEKRTNTLSLSSFIFIFLHLIS